MHTVPIKKSDISKSTISRVLHGKTQACPTCAAFPHGEAALKFQIAFRLYVNKKNDHKSCNDITRTTAFAWYLALS